MAFHVMFLLIWLATAMNYHWPLIHCLRTKLCRLLLQSRDEAKWLLRPSLDEFLIRMLDYGFMFPDKHTWHACDIHVSLRAWKVHETCNMHVQNFEQKASTMSDPNLLSGFV